jgi:Putative adhesin
MIPMRTKIYAFLAVPAAAVLLAFAPSGAPPQDDFRWSGAVAAGQRLEIKGVNGGIRAEPASGNQVEVTAVKRAGRRGRAQDVRIERVMHGGGVTICAVYPSGRRNRPNRCTAGDEWSTNVEDNDVNVEWVVRVPRGVHFVGKTVNGAVSARSMPADADVSTVNGAVTVSAAGVVQASTVNGDIDATTGRADAGRDLEFQTVNGDIVLRVPADFRARVDAELLNGSIRSDFPLEIRRGRYVGSSAEGEIGRGGRRLKMETVNGDLEIRRAGGR